MNKIKKYFVYLLNFPIYLVSILIPKDKNLIIFGSSIGRHFADNSKYLYLYLKTHTTDESKKMIWITKNKELNKYLNSLDYSCEYLYSVKGLFYTIRANKVFITHQLDDLNGALISGAEIIQLWHGIPLKKIGYKGDWSPVNIKGKLKVLLYKFFPFTYYMSCDKLITSSKTAKDIFVEPFSISFRNKRVEDNILVLGQPRNDALLPGYIFDDRVFPEIKQLRRYQARYSEIISWLPTHRTQLGKTIVDLMVDSNLNLQHFNDFCKQYNILFIIKPHFLELKLLEDKISNFSNIQILDASDPYPLLHYTDILITDYSSIYFDYLITNKPIIFAPFDFSDYERKIDFYFDYNDVTPGAKCSSWKCIMEQISLLVNGIDEFKNDREKFMSEIKLVKYNNCKIIYDYFFIN